MDSADIRSRFLRFYADRGHEVVPSASLVPSSYDPSVLLTTAGMQPFKPYFMGEAEPPAPRLASCQKCFRTPDIDEVGSTARHLTFFEMLGNFSVGDYFKAGAIEAAWELVTGVLGLDPERLWVTVHEGSEALGIGPDEEAIELWVAQGMPRERIVQLGSDNFWSAGPTGPCGPCSELYYDRGVEHDGGSGEVLPGGESDRFLEFYNLVFMQYNRAADGTLSDLPTQNIDTGMGLERISSILQGGVSVFEVDSMQALIRWAEQASGRSYGQDSATTKALRVIADHGRGMSFLVADGVLPGNEGRGYVLRRVIRRAIQQADRIGLYPGGRTGVLAALAGQVVDTWGDAYPELRSARSEVQRVLDTEEERFLRTLEEGSGRLARITAAAGGPGATISGEDAFQLHDTYGFPIELTGELAREQGLAVDLAGFERLMEQQRVRAREAATSGRLVAPDAAAAFARQHPAGRFVGYGQDEVETTVVAVEGIDDDHALVRLAASPFYAEGGGQVSDSGTITGPSGQARIIDVLRFEDDQVLVVTLDGRLAAGDAVTAVVDRAARRATEAHHTATHLLHRALRDELGDHVRQAGSLVAPDRLRFDFTHPEPLSSAELARIEGRINDAIAAGLPVSWVEVPIDEARERGAMMLFGEKYGDQVRMVSVGDGLSRELCGGTHVPDTSRIRLLVVTGESSVGADTRRIEAVTGDPAIQLLRERSEAAARASAELNVPVDRLAERVSSLRSELRDLRRELSAARSGGHLGAASESAVAGPSGTLISYRADGLGPDELLDLSDRLRSRHEPAVVVLGAATDEKVHLLAAVSDALVDDVHAGRLIGEVAPLAGGRGGGRPGMARAGGSDPAGLDAALSRAAELAGTALGLDTVASGQPSA